ncbi:MAG: nuclear transport factor 2 family protein [Methanobacteriota archaeon]|nr:MAG: nuclear transport factor 2 family protein [Euryarchaeota archaeon]
MGSSGGSAPLRAEEVVRRFYDFLARGRLVDALNLFTTDARLRDPSGRESAGIRAITSSLLTYRVPQDIAVEQMEPEDGEIRATVRSPSGRSIGRFSVARGRIKSLRMERA